MKKTPWGRLALCSAVLLVLMVFVPSFAFAHAAEYGDYDYEVVTGGVEITAYYGNGGALTVPAKISGKPVVSIGEGAFMDVTGLTSVSLPNTVTKIGDFAFMACTRLSKVTMPTGLTKIGMYSFFECGALTTISIPTKVSSIGQHAFYSCKSLTAFSVSSSNAYFTASNGVLYNKAKTALVAFPGGKSGAYAILSTTKTVNAYAFLGCAKLTGITIPASVTTIGDLAFAECIKLTSVAIPASVTKLGINPFESCTSLTAVNVAAANPSYSSLYGLVYNKIKTRLILCPAAKAGAIGLPSTVTTVSKEAFCGCAKITAFSMASVSVIEDGAFIGCKALKSFTVPAKVKAIANYAFVDCTAMTALTLPAGLTSIGDFAFADCKALTTLSIPATVTKVGTCAFYSDSRLAKIIFAGNKPSFGEAAFEDVPTSCKVFYHVSRASSWTGFRELGKQAYCTATINLQNGSAATKVMTNVTGGHIAAPVTPARTGYVFGGWYKDAACTTAWKFATDVVTNDVSIFAKWTIPAPAVPGSVAAAPLDTTSVKVTWAAAANAKGYEVWTSLSADGTYTLLGSVATLSYTNTGLTQGTMYFYKVRAYNQVNGVKAFGQYSAAVSAQP